MLHAHITVQTLEVTGYHIKGNKGVLCYIQTNFVTRIQILLVAFVFLN